MQAWRVHELAGLDALRLETMPPPPAPGEGEVLLDVLAVGLNFPDLLMLSGGYQYRPGLPFTPGMEGVGRVVAVGEGVAADLLGARMLLGGRTGLLAEQVMLPLSALRPAPEPLDDDEAAAFSVGALTAHVALAVRGRLVAGEHLLVAGGGGGMGLAAIAMGKALGARVTALASTPEKLALARWAGADVALAIDRAAPDLAALRNSVDVLFDPVGGALVAPALSTLRWGGRYLVVGFAGGMPPRLALNRTLLKGIEVVGVRAGEAGRQDPDAGRRHIHAIDDLAAAGLLRPIIGLTTRMADAPEAFAAMADGRLAGKAVVRVAETG
jgi:NADPH2:quinone reductase